MTRLPVTNRLLQNNLHRSTIYRCRYGVHQAKSLTNILRNYWHKIDVGVVKPCGSLKIVPYPLIIITRNSIRARWPLHSLPTYFELNVKMRVIEKLLLSRRISHRLYSKDKDTDTDTAGDTEKIITLINNIYFIPMEI